MFRNYLKTAFRNFFNNKLYSGINIAGLALGMAVAILILLYIQNEQSYDRWVPQSEQVYRIYRQWHTGGRVVWTPDPLAEALADELPEVVAASGLSMTGEVLLARDRDKRYVDDGAVVDSTFFEVVHLPLLHGDPAQVMDAPNALVLSRELAESIFGETNPVGETLRYNDEVDLVVTGVLADLPGNSHLNYRAYGRFSYQAPSWTGNNRATYIRVQPGTDIGMLEQKVTKLANGYWAREYEEMGRDYDPDRLPAWRLQPMQDIHLYSKEMSWMGGSGDIKLLYIFAIVAAVVLLIAGINYVNLSTARAVGRSLEVGVRKVTGAKRSQLMGQFFTETALQTLMALVLALGLAQLLLPLFNRIVHRDLTLIPPHWQPFALGLLGLTALISLLAGAYPALVLSGFRPVQVLKGKTAAGRKGGGFRRVLVVFQFSLSVVLVIVMLFIYKQVNFMMDQELGFADDQILVVPMNTDESTQKVRQLEREFRRIPGVEEMTMTSRMPGHFMPDWTVDIGGMEESQNPYVIFTDEHFTKTLGIDLLQGRYFSKDHPTDTTLAFVVNETFVKNYGIEDPVGTQLKFAGQEDYGQIIGVIKDYHYAGLDRSIRPLMVAHRPEGWNYAGFKVSAANFSSTLAAIKSVWSEVEPAHPMRFSFLDEEFAQQYDEYKRFGQALLYATFLAILIAALGLFGLAAYTATTRTKEIGVRKVLGASISQISFMLMKDFVRWVLIGSLIAIPVGYWLAQHWLEDFAYQTSLSALPFMASVLVALVIAVVTVSSQAVRAASRNPVEALRYE